MDETKIINKLLEHDQKFEQLITKQEFNHFKNEVQANFDEALQILRRLD